MRDRSEISRFRLDRIEPAAGSPRFADDVRRGLCVRPKSLQPKYFYDDLGSLLFEAICRLPEYYVTRAENEILEGRSEEIAAAAGPATRVLELGSGSAEKTRHLLAALLARQGRLHYLPIDISEAALESSAADLLVDFPTLTIHAFASDYRSGLQAFGRLDRSSGSTLALFLGSNLGNLDPREQRELIGEIRAVLAPGDGFLLGLDLRKPEEVLLPAYDDALGVTAAFNKNLLLRMNRELGADFDLRSFRHRVRYDDARGRIEMHLESLVAQRVTLAGLGGLVVEFDAGETIFTEASHKFDDASVGRLASEVGFRLERTWTDSAGRFASMLLRAQ